MSFHFLFSSHFSHASYSIFTKEIVYLFLCLAPNRYEPRLGRKEYTGEYSGSAITTVHVSCCGELDKCKRCTREEQNRRWGPLGTGTVSKSPLEEMKICKWAHAVLVFVRWSVRPIYFHYYLTSASLQFYNLD